jgi:hypothetical protein
MLHNAAGSHAGGRVFKLDRSQQRSETRSFPNRRVETKEKLLRILINSLGENTSSSSSSSSSSSCW